MYICVIHSECFKILSIISILLHLLLLSQSVCQFNTFLFNNITSPIIYTIYPSSIIIKETKILQRLYTYCYYIHIRSKRVPGALQHRFRSSSFRLQKPTGKLNSYTIECTFYYYSIVKIAALFQGLQMITAFRASVTLPTKMT